VREEEKRGLVYIIVWLVGWFVCLLVFLIFIFNFFFGKIFIDFEVLEKNLEASFYFSVLPKKKQWKRCSFT